MNRFTVTKRPDGYWVMDWNNKNELVVRFRLKRDALALAKEWNREECAKVSERNYLADRPELRRASFRLIVGGAA